MDTWRQDRITLDGVTNYRRWPKRTQKYDKETTGDKQLNTFDAFRGVDADAGRWFWHFFIAANFINAHPFSSHLREFCGLFTSSKAAVLKPFLVLHLFTWLVKVNTHIPV